MIENDRQSSVFFKLPASKLAELFNLVHKLQKSFTITSSTKRATQRTGQFGSSVEPLTSSL